MNPFDIAGKVIAITGGQGFLGQQWGHYLTAENARVWYLDLPEVDVTDRLSLVDAYVRMGEPDTLICAAAIDAKPGQENPKDPWQSWDDIIYVNLTGVARTCRFIGGFMKPGSSIILVSSMYGMVSPDQRRYDDFVKPAAYSASKAGLYGLCRYLATLFGPKSIRVNCVTFGAMASPGHPERFTKSMEAAIPLGRLAQPGDWNGPIHFLVSDASSYMTGANLVVDGGYTAW